MDVYRLLEKIRWIKLFSSKMLQIQIEKKTQICLSIKILEITEIVILIFLYNSEILLSVVSKPNIYNKKNVQIKVKVAAACNRSNLV